MTDKRAITPLDLHIGRKIAEARTFRKLSQAQLGGELSLSGSQIQKYECGRDRVTAGVLFRIARVLGLSPLWFYEGLEDIDRGVTPPPIDGDGRKLLQAYDRLPTDIGRGIIAFMNALADGMAIGRSGAE